MVGPQEAWLCCVWSWNTGSFWELVGVLDLAEQRRELTVCWQEGCLDSWLSDVLAFMYSLCHLLDIPLQMSGLFPPSESVQFRYFYSVPGMKPTPSSLLLKANDHETFLSQSRICLQVMVSLSLKGFFLWFCLGVWGFLGLLCLFVSLLLMLFWEVFIPTSLLIKQLLKMQLFFWCSGFLW